MDIFDRIKNEVICTSDSWTNTVDIIDRLNHPINEIKKHHVYIYRADALAELDIEAESPQEARKLAKEMLNNKPYSDINESDFKDPDTEFIFMTFDEHKIDLKSVGTTKGTIKMP